ncbi:MAG: hypothetical protein FWF28_01230, partial [Micrococcales bacterium]|nr:hypothetical protein [Micrococcales bacterium]
MRSAWWRWTAAGLVAGLAVMTVVALPAGSASAAATVAFTPKFQANANGAMITIGNNLLTCPAGSISTTVANVPCADARNGAAVNNNSYTMSNLDADSDPTTDNSSSSTLALPAGSTVLWAGLYWGARLQAGTGGKSASASTIDRMSFKAPGDASYRTIAASTAARDQFGPNSSSYNAYQRFADVTSIVRAAGNGSYWGANVTAATGQDRYAGWAMTVVYTAPGLPLRNLTVFDGFDTVSQGTSQTVTVSGFLSPKSGAVDAQLTMLAYEGDLSQTGDYVKLNNTQLATAISPGSNFFNSANDLNGTSVTTRTPDDRNMLGFDIKNLGVSGAIDNNATSATFTFASTGDMYYPGLVGLAINLYAPDFTASSKTVVDLNGNNPARPGDTLQYTLNYTNTGQDPATGVVSTDVLPANTTYVPGSLVLNPLTAPQRLTDASGDDAGEYLAATRTVQVRLGSGASATAGGTLGCSGAGCATSPPSMAWYSFQVTLDGAAGGTTVTNIANLRYVTATTGTAATYPTAPATTPVVRQADVSIAKTMAPSPVPAGWTAGDPIPVGTTVAATLLVTNNGPSTATDVTVNDPIPADWTGVALASPTSGCAIAAGALTCALGDLTNGQRVTITLTGRTAANSTATSLTNTATVTTTAADPVPANNVSSATVGLGQQADLSVTKTAAVTSGPPGSAVTWTVTAKNNGPSDATNVLISDGLDAADQATLTAATLAAGGTCAASTGRAVRCAVTTLPAGTTATMTVTGVLGSNLAAGTVVGNTALVSANTPDPNPANNTATAGVTTTAPQADVRVTKTGPAAVVPGQSISWTVTATNFGPSDAAGVVVTDTVPDGVSNLTALTTRGTCQPPAGQVIACPVGTLVSGGPGVAGAAAAVTITGIVAADAAGSPAGTLVNTASATATTADPAPGNNSAQASTTLTPQVDLAVAKTATRTTLPNAAGQPVTYTIAVTNNGPSAARNVTVTDLVPLVLGLGPGAVTTTAAGGTCDTSQASQAQPAPNGDYGLITCTLPGPILPGAGNAVTITVPMTSTAPLTPAPGTDVLETASATAAGATDTNPGNNSATWILSGDPYVDLAVTTSAPATVVAGNLASGNPQYTVTVTNTNDPNNPTESVPALRPVITDTLPPGVTLNTAGSGATVTSGPAGQGVTCTVAGQVLTCQLVQDLNAGESVTVTIPVIIDTNALPGSTLTNVVSVATADATSNPSGNPDRNPANDTAQAASVVIAVADPRVSIQSLAPVDAAVSGPGSSWTLSFSVGNNGPSTARQSQVHVEVAVPHTWLGPLPSGCAVAAGELVCQFGDLPQGVANVYQVTFAVMGYAVPGSFVSTVHISSVSPEPDTPMALANNTANITRTLGDATTDLAVSKVPLGTVPNPDETTGAHPSFVAGGAFAYQFQVQVPGADDPTAGAGDAQDVVVTDTMPAGFIPQQVDASQGTCLVTNPGGTTPVAGGTAIRCALGTVDGYTGAPTVQPVTVTVNGTVDPSVGTAEQVPNTVHAATDTPLASRALDVTASADVDVVEQGDLQLHMTPDAATVTAGGRAGYTLTV